MVFLKRLVFLILLALLPVISQAQLCQISEESLLKRQKFLTDFQVMTKKDLADIRKTARDAHKTLRLMKGAHLASKISMTISAVAGLVAGGAAISSLYFSGQSVAFVGLTVQPGTIGAHLYSTYAIGSNVVTLGQVGWDLWKDDKTPQEYLNEQMAKLRRQAFFSEDAVVFLTEPDWSGWSDKLQSPVIQASFLKLDKFYEDNIKAINDSDNLWSYVGEFWHKKGLKRAALDVAVADEAIKLQQLRIAYFDLLIKMLENHRHSCYSICL